MKFPYHVKHDGIDYAPGEDVPIEKPKAVEEVKEETKTFGYTKTQINRLSTAELQKLAIENGIDSSKSGAEIKKLIITKYQL